MKREHIHRIIAAFLCAVMVMAECPPLIQTAQATELPKALDTSNSAEAAEPTIGLGVDDLSVTYTGGSWSYADGSLTGSIENTEMEKTKTAILTFTNSGQTEKVLKFDYSATIKSGVMYHASTLQVCNEEKTEVKPDDNSDDPVERNVKTENLLTIIKAGEATQVIMVAGDGDEFNGGSVTITISNITFTVKQGTSVTFAEAEHGSYTVKGANGETLGIGTTYPVESITKFTVNATPAEGYKFLRWEVAGGAQLSPEQSGELMVPTGGTVQPVFVPEDTPIFRVGAQAFGDLAEAIGCAQEENSAKTIVMTSDGSLKAGVTYTIPDGVTLLVPYADKQITETYMEKSPEESSGRDPWTINAGDYTKAPYANRGRTDPGRSGADVLSPVMNPLADGKVHRTLTIPATTTVRIEKGGVFSVGGVMSGGGHGTVAAAGGIIGQHSNIQLDGSIEVAGVFSCNGFVLGDGSITTELGGAIYEPFVVMDFHAGSWTLAAVTNANLAPIFLRYTMPNIQTDMTIVYGSHLYAYCDLIAGTQHNTTTGVIIGDRSDSAVIQLTAESSQVVMTYAAAETVTYEANRERGVETAFASVGKSSLTITGGANYGALELKVTGNAPIKSSMFPLPLPYNVDITLESGQYAIDKHFYIMPGANLTVGSGATLTLGDGVEYDAAQNNGRANIAVLDGLLEHTSHGNADADIEKGTIQAMAYPTPAELQASGFNPNGGLIVGKGGRLVLGDHVAFGGIIQANGNGAEVTAKTSAALTCTVNIGLSTGSYRGRTEHELTAQMVGSDALIDVVSAKSYTATGTETCTKASFEYKLYGNTGNAYMSTECTTQYTSSITLHGGFTGASDSPYAATVIVSNAETHYTDFTTAWNKAVEAGNATVRLEKLVTYAGATTLTLGSSKTLTLDLNGYELVSSGADTTIKNSGVLTVKGGVLSSTKTAGRNPIRLIHNTGKLTLSATLKLANTAASGNYYCLYNDANATLNLDGANIAANVSSSSSYALYNAATAAIDSAKFSTITASSGDALYNLGTIADGVLANGNVFTGCRYAVYTTSAVNITGGTYKIDGHNTRAGETGKPGRAALYCADSENETNISGGSFTVENSKNFCAAVYNAGKIRSITGVTYTGGRDDDAVFFNAAGGTIGEIVDISVTGVTAAVVQNYGTITEIRSADVKNKPEFFSSGSKTILNAGKILTIQNYTIKGKFGTAIHNNGTGTISRIESCEIRSQGSCVVNQGKSTIAIIKDCKLETTSSTDPALNNYGNNTIGTISGSTIIGQKYALQNKGTINKITGGCDFKATGSNDDGTNYKDTDLVAAVWNSGTIEEISGKCTFTANHIRAHGLFNNTNGKTPKVENCTFKAEGTYGNAFYNWGTFENGVIQGCTFTASGTGGAAFCNRNQTGSAKIGTLKGCTFTVTGAPEAGNSSSALVNEAKGGTGTFLIDKIIDCKFIATGAGSKALMNQVTGSATGTAQINEISGCTFTAEGKIHTYTPKSGTAITNISNALVNQVTGSAAGTAQIGAIINCEATGQRCAVYNTCNSTGAGATAVINTISGGTFNNTEVGDENNKDGTVYNLAKSGTAKIGTIQGCTINSVHSKGNAVRNNKAECTSNTVVAVAEIGSIIDCDLTADFTALGNYVNSGRTGNSNNKTVIGKIDGGTFTATNDNAITNNGGTINLISGGSFVVKAANKNALYSKSTFKTGTNGDQYGAKASIGAISGGYFDNSKNTGTSWGGAVRIYSGTIGAVTGGIFVEGSGKFAAFIIDTPKTVVSGGVFKATGTYASKPLADGIIATGCKKSSTTVSVMLPNGTTTTGFYAVAPKNGCTITVSGSGIADVSLDGMGSGYEVTDKVTVSAPQVKGCTFNGWYRSEPEKRWSTDLVVKTTVAQMLADGLFDENGKADLVAKYDRNESAALLTLTLNNAPGATVSWGGIPQTSTSNTWNVPVGTEVTINATGVSNFRYWTNANDKVMSKEKTYKFTMVTNTTLTAETSADSTFVIFQSADGRLLKADALNNINEFPDAPYRVGYTFAGWKVGNKTVSTAQEITANMATNGIVTVTAAYEAVATSCTVNAYTVVNGAESLLQSSSTPLGDIATFTAPETVNGSSFRFWASNKDGTNILSFSQKYSFRVTQQGTTIYAIYGGENNPTAQPVVRVDDVLAKEESNVKSLTFMIGANVPEGYQLVEMGALYTKDVDSGNDTTLRVENVGNSTGSVRKAVSKLTQQKDLTDYSYALGFKVSGGQESSKIYLRGYVAVKKTDDSTGTIYYYYSGVTSRSYDTVNSQGG